MTHRNLLMATLLIVLMGASGVAVSACFAQKAAVPRSQDKHALAGEKVRELVALMDADKNGKISKQEWMRFMAAEFDRLDQDKKGQLDPKELLRWRQPDKSVSFADAGK